mgnify:CR=1 FL=1
MSDSEKKRTVNNWFAISRRASIISLCLNIVFMAAMVIGYFSFEERDHFIIYLFVIVLVKLIIDVVLRVFKV